MDFQLPTNRVYRQLLFWLGVLLFWSIIPLINPQMTWDNVPTLWGALLVPSLLSWLFHAYVLAYGLIPLLMTRQFGRFTLGVVLLNLAVWFLYDALFYGYVYSLTHWLHQAGNSTPQTWLFWSPFPGDNFRESNLTAGLFASLVLFSNWQSKLTEAQRLEREKLRQELALLKLQLNPSLLFDSLATLHHHVCYEPLQAPAIVLNLAHYLRYVLYESSATEVPLTHETEGLEQYIFLQRATRPDISISFSMRGIADSHTIVPVLLLPLVEWGFESAQRTYPTEPAWMSVDLMASQTDLTLKIIHSSRENETAILDQILINSRKQLDALYGGAYSLQLINQPEAHLLVLQLPVGMDQSSPFAKKEEVKT